MTRGEKLARVAVGLAALWVLGVSSIKLFLGTPSSLPPLVRDGWFGPDLNFRLSIAVELAFALVALIWPRRGFAPLALLYAVFVAVLVQLISQGAKSCGCFGGAITFPPALMISVDATLLVLMLAARPWKTISPGKPPYLALAAAVALAAIQPWIWIPPQPPAPVAVPPIAGGPEEPSPAAPTNAQAPVERPRYVVLEPEDWAGKSIHETELAPWLDTWSLPGDATWVLYFVSCEHCERYLQRLKSEFADDPKLYVMVELGEKDGEERRVVDPELDMPPGEHAKTPDDIQWVITPPWELILEGHTVKEAVDRGKE
jgi:hypothetical protein